MVDRQWWPQKMLSDNGTNFVEADNELRLLVEKIDPEVVQRMTAIHGVTWYWNPPAAPHFGGVFESMIKAAKRAISAVLLNADVTDEELQTVFIGVESLMNSRPLTTISGDPNDEPVLTQNYFLIGQMGGELALQSSQSLDASPAGTHSLCVASMDAGVLAADWLQTEVVLSDGESAERRCCACDKS